ncbi:MAG: hypothetical protein A2315_04745 [Ignavibacteria bacterium RIFOXYB2_FULL_35_12]|nr:MAG: hypothetical protein A2058_00390 [Ignavibacteria bacterium GWA2_36_19]OGU62585.1 MAG: hypothetical protein A2X60_07885 [Ignavibacteria bacterium GWF2_35_20]OGU79399.1 MAG: hypothetical protein A2254_04835 [Ignavibacteria bacterium RIFOXYA2_FULL_35_9]OGU89626.1 MAG: hypothetical protein A3K31_15695 [Ignavibacteria bacterium RIFOXYA12_FULL_35_25]OGU94678.1 MAG: hypothetical protein A2347_03465 [Ignavibacteria bacterium RIFOXYB12_FULL_35_14]OGV01665.1 MAG: hypothetical protein A2455_12735
MYQHQEKNKNEIINQFCNHCGRSVKLGSGMFVNRIPDMNDLITRISNKRKFPKGDFVCIECDEHSERNQ